MNAQRSISSQQHQQQSQQALPYPRKKVNTHGNTLLKWYQLTAQPTFKQDHLSLSHALFQQSPHHTIMITIPMSEVKKHNTMEDCWTVIHGVVYDISAYLKFHPGGIDVLMKEASGRDCTQMFELYHSWVNLERLLEKCVLGRVDTSR